MIKEYFFTGKTIDEAIQSGCRELSMDRDDLSVEVIDTPSRSFLGLKVTPAKVKLSIEVPDEPKPKPAPRTDAAPQMRPAQPQQQWQQRPQPQSAPQQQQPRPQGQPFVLQQPKPAFSQQQRPQNQPQQPKPQNPAQPQRPQGSQPAAGQPAVQQQRPPFQPRPQQDGRVQSPRPDQTKREPVLNRAPNRDGRPQPQRAEVSEADLKTASENVSSFLTEVMGILETGAKVSATGHDGIVDADLVGENMGIIIGRRGETLDSLQYLASLVANRGHEEYIKVNLDTENYRQKREASLTALAQKVASKVEKNQKSMTLEPMNPYERRIIHSVLQDNASVVTASVGSEPNRKVVIYPAGAEIASRPTHSRHNRHRRPGGTGAPTATAGAETQVEATNPAAVLAPVAAPGNAAEGSNNT